MFLTLGGLTRRTRETIRGIVSIRFQLLVGQRCTVGRRHAISPRPILLNSECMADNMVPIAPSSSRTLLHLR